MPAEDRGISVHSVRLSFHAAGVSAFWRGLAEGIGANMEGNDEAWGASFAALGPDQRCLFGDLHMSTTEADRAHWILDLDQMRGATPPQSVIDWSKRIGGYPSLLAQIADLWPENERVCSALIRATYVLPTSRWRSGLSLDRQQTIKFAGLAAIPTGITWRLEPKSGIVSSIGETSLDREVKAQIVTGRGVWDQLSITGDFLEAAEHKIWEGVQPLLIGVESR